MTWLRKTRPLLVAAGGVVLVGSLLGARLLGPGSGGGTDTSGKAPPAAPPGPAGTVVLGTADSDPEPGRYGLPSVLQSGEVAEVFVKQGEDVKAGAKLYRFDTTMLEQKVDQAKLALARAQTTAATARGAIDQHGRKVELQKQVVAAADSQVKLAWEAWRLAEQNIKDGYKANNFLPETWDGRLKNEVELYKLHAVHEGVKYKAAIEKATLADLEAAKVNQLDKLVGEADSEVKRYEGMIRAAETEVRLCTVTAKLDGNVERVSISPGDTIGFGARAPALILIPAGPRVVRARVEAEFAHKIGPAQKGKTVTIHDFTDPKVSYQGVVRDIGGSFLPRRGNEGALVQNETRALEVVIQVTDPAPPGRPPLRVGQEVRVHFGP